MEENQLDLVPLFGYGYSGHTVVNGAVELTVDCVLDPAKRLARHPDLWDARDGAGV